MERKKIIAIILSGGIGTRLKSDIPKQYIKVNGRSIISYCLETFSAHSQIDSIFIVAAEEWRDYILEDAFAQNISMDKFISFVDPGETRQLSICNALEAIRKASENKEIDLSTAENLVMIHDAARPCVSSELITGLIEAYDGYDGVMPVLPMKNTVYISKDGHSISALLDRGTIFEGHTPELFEFSGYYEANKALFPEDIKKINGSSEVAVMAAMKIAMIENDEYNFKITTVADLDRFKNMIKSVSTSI